MLWVFMSPKSHELSMPRSMVMTVSARVPLLSGQMLMYLMEKGFTLPWGDGVRLMDRSLGSPKCALYL